MGNVEPKGTLGKKHNRAEFSNRGVACALSFTEIDILFLWWRLRDSFDAIPLESSRLDCREHIFLAVSTLHGLKTELSSEAL